MRADAPKSYVRLDGRAIGYLDNLPEWVRVSTFLGEALGREGTRIYAQQSRSFLDVRVKTHSEQVIEHCRRHNFTDGRT